MYDSFTRLLVLKEQLSDSAAPGGVGSESLGCVRRFLPGVFSPVGGEFGTDQIEGNVRPFRTLLASLTQAGNGLLRPVQFQQNDTEVVQRIRIARIDGYGPLEFLNPLLELLLAQGGHRQVVVPMERVRGKFDNLAKPLNGSGSIPGLQVQKPKPQVRFCQLGIRTNRQLELCPGFLEAFRLLKARWPLAR